jgi:ribosomal protein S24E
MNIKKDLKNELSKRKEIEFEIEAGKNPSFDEMKKLIAEKFSKSEDCIDVYGIKGSFGKNKFLIKGYIYDSKKDLEVAIQKTAKQRKEEIKQADEAKKAVEEAKKAEEEAKKKVVEEAKIA